MFELGEVIRYRPTISPSRVLRRAFMVSPCHIFGSAFAYSRTDSPPCFSLDSSHAAGNGEVVLALLLGLLDGGIARGDLCFHLASMALRAFAIAKCHADLDAEALGLDEVGTLLVDQLLQVGQAVTSSRSKRLGMLISRAADSQYMTPSAK
ncbi:hypothetical protein D3C87_1332040 [compost metagenome]